MELKIGLCAALFGASLSVLPAQTRIDLRTQGKSADFSSASSTKPFQTGTSLPETCSVGQAYFKSDAEPGANLYACTSVNTWSAVGAKETVGGDLWGPLGNLKITKLQGKAVVADNPADGDVLTWNAATGQWQASNTLRGGPNLPEVCAAGEMYFKTIPVAGKNLHVCTAANTWTPLGAGEIPAFTSYPGRVLSNNGSATRWIDPDGDASGSLGNLRVTRLQGRPVASSGPGDGSVLKWNQAAGQWEPASAIPSGTALPPACDIGQAFFKTDAPAGMNMYLCTASNTWSAVSMKELPPVSGKQGKVLGNDGTSAAWIDPGGDVSGALGNLTVARLQGKTLAGANPIDGNVLYWNGAASQWEPANPVAAGASLPPHCGAGQEFLNTAEPAGENLYICTAADTWTRFGATKELPPLTGAEEKLLAGQGTAVRWIVPGGDVSGPVENLTVTKLHGKAVRNTEPTEGNVLRWSGATGQWEPGAAGIPNYSVAFSLQTSINIPGASHGLGTANLLVLCYDAGSPPRRVEPDSVSVDPSSLNVEIRFAVAQSGRCVVNGSGGSTGAGGGGIANLDVGAGMMLVQTPNLTVIGVDTAVVPTYLTNTTLLSIPSIATGACGEAVIPLQGATIGDSVAAGWPATIGGGVIGTMWVKTANEVSIRLCNLSGAPAGALTDYFRATIVRSF